MYDSILVPTDGSQEMRAVLDQAIELTGLCDATLHVLHIIDERAFYSIPNDSRDRVRETLTDDAETFMESAADAAQDAGLKVVQEIRWGDPASEILSYATEQEIAIIVMGTHGRTGYERYLLGSVAEKVVRMAPMPVLAIAVGDTDEQRREILQATSTESAERTQQ